jgi:hypothetical protein
LYFYLFAIYLLTLSGAQTLGPMCSMKRWDGQ